MNGPTIIPGKRLNPVRYVMRSILINRFSFIALWFWFSGMAMAYGGATGNLWIFLAGVFATVVGAFPVADWETEREAQADAPARIVEQLDRAADALNFTTREKKIAIDGLRGIAKRAAWTP